MAEMTNHCQRQGQSRLPRRTNARAPGLYVSISEREVSGSKAVYLA